MVIIASYFIDKLENLDQNQTFWLGFRIVM